METNAPQATPDISRREMDERTKLLLFAGVWVIAAAVLVTLLAPHGTPLQRCMGAALSSSREQCLYSLAVGTGNSSICADISEPDADSCYLALAESGNDLALCSSIEDQNSSAACVQYVANATDTPSDCYSLSGSARDACIGPLALKEMNASLCSSLSAATSRSACSSSIYFGDALRLSNASYCANVYDGYDPNITSTVLVDSDAFNYSKVETNLSGYVTLLAFMPGTAEFSARDFCYLSYAAQYDNQSACSTIANSTLSSSCSYITSPQQPNVTSSQVNYTQLLSVCSSESGQNATACTALITSSEALSTKNASLCSTMALNYSYECYASLAAQYMNTTYCGYIKNSTVYSACIQDIYYNASAVANDTPSGYP